MNAKGWSGWLDGLMVGWLVLLGLAGCCILSHQIVLAQVEL